MFPQDYIFLIFSCKCFFEHLAYEKVGGPISPSPYERGLTRIVARFWFYIKIYIWPLQLSRIFSKFETKHWLLFNQFLSDFDDSHVILTRIISQIWICFRNQNQTIIAQTAMILVYAIEFPCQNWAGRMTHCVIFLRGRGEAVFSQPFIWQYIKKHSTDGHGRYDLQLPWEKSKLYTI